jgi:hypothetical protein
MGTRVQAVPFHRMMTVLPLASKPVSPTAQALSADVSATPPSAPVMVGKGAAGVGRLWVVTTTATTATVAAAPTAMPPLTGPMCRGLR